MRRPPALACFLAVSGLTASCEDAPVAARADASVVAGDAGPTFQAVALPSLGSPQPNFFDVWGTSPSQVFLVGERGTVLRGDGRDWIVEPTPTTEDLRGVWGYTTPDPMGGPDRVDMLAVGNGGTILRRSDAGWTTELSPVTADLRAIRGRRSRAYAVGVDGAMITRDLNNAAAAWTTVMVPTQETMHGLWIDEGGMEGVAVGNLGLVLRLQDDGTWVRQRIDGLSVPLQGVWGTGPSALWIVGLDGTILRSEGGGFREIRGAPTFYLRRVVGLGGGEVWITAWGGNLLRVSGDEVTTFSDFSDHRLEGIWATVLDVETDAGIVQVPRYYVTGVTGQVLVGP